MELLKGAVPVSATRSPNGCRKGHRAGVGGKGPPYLCPLISATSVMPPTLKRKYSRFKARAMERAILVLPTPGGP